MLNSLGNKMEPCGGCAAVPQQLHLELTTQVRAELQKDGTPKTPTQPAYPEGYHSQWRDILQRGPGESTVIPYPVALTVKIIS